MIVEQSFFKLPLMLMSFSGKVGGINNNFLEATLVGLLHSCLVKELENSGMVFASTKVLLEQYYPKISKCYPRANGTEIKKIYQKCDIKVDLTDLDVMAQMGIYGCRKVNWIEAKFGNKERSSLIADIIRLGLLSAKNNGKYLLFVSNKPASDSLQAKRTHLWINKVFEESKVFAGIDILENETETQLKEIRKNAPLRKDDSTCKISGRCFSFKPVVNEKMAGEFLKWYGYLLRLDKVCLK